MVALRATWTRCGRVKVVGNDESLCIPCLAAIDVLYLVLLVPPIIDTSQPHTMFYSVLWQGYQKTRHIIYVEWFYFNLSMTYYNSQQKQKQKTPLWPQLQPHAPPDLLQAAYQPSSSYASAYTESTKAIQCLKTQSSKPTTVVYFGVLFTLRKCLTLLNPPANYVCGA